MNIIEAARNLADEIAKNEVIIALQNARHDYMHNDSLANTAREYMVQSAALEEEMKKGEAADKETMKVIKDRMMQLGAELNESEEIKKLRDAEEKANELLSQINAILDRAISGEEEEESCGHDCSHCAGCH